MVSSGPSPSQFRGIEAPGSAYIEVYLTVSIAQHSNLNISGFLSQMLIIL